MQIMELTVYCTSQLTNNLLYIYLSCAVEKYILASNYIVLMISYI
ncbi:hypothetical protein SRABI36_00290 [Pedobacter sp. Bi36]|nr:hypothetical protein SRABI36_00290 [Pedobacter sp. Bi36]CAH0186212.1 hypothetical protein SRABI126_01384 [Pedobacter sp. Bi126]